MPGLPGAPGPAGPAGPVSLPDVYVARGAPDKVLVSAGGGPVELVRLMVAPGSYLMTAKLVAEGADSEEPFTGTVTLSTGDVAGFGHGNSNPKQISNFLWWPLVLHDVATFARPTVITLSAAADNHGWHASDAILTALRVGVVIRGSIGALCPTRARATYSASDASPIRPATGLGWSA